MELLAHYQPADSAVSTPLPADVADMLVMRLVCERISQRRIRMLPPSSVFAAAKLCPEVVNYIPKKLPPAEVEGTWFKPPKSADETCSTIPRMRYLPRFRETYGDDQLQRSLA